MEKFAVFIVLAVILNMCTGNPVKRIKNPAIISTLSVLDQTARIWGWYKFPQDAMGIPDQTGKITQNIIDALGKKIKVDFIPISHAKEANFNSPYDVIQYNKKLIELDAQCRDELFLKKNKNIINDVQIHYFMSNCLMNKGLSDNDFKYRKLYKFYNKDS